MDYQLGLLGLLEFIYTKVLSKKQLNNDEITQKEMEDFCNKTAEKYGITRGINLLDLQYKIANAGYYDEEVGMKNEDAIQFLEKEREEIRCRKEEMFDRMSQLPVDSFFSADKECIETIHTVEKGSLRELLYSAGDYIEREGIDFLTDEYLEKIYNWVRGLIEEIDNELAKLYKGKNGEDYVSQQLKLYEGKYKVLENIVIESNDSQGETSEVDAYIITDKGLVVAEVKNFGNENQRLHITSDGRWVMEDVHNGHILRRIEKSPVEQNARHCLAIERLLTEEFGEDCEIPIIPVVFIANNKVAIQNESQSSVIRVSEFYTFINSISNGAKVSKDVQAKIEEILKKKDIGAREFGVKSRLQKMKCLEELEEEFTKYILYNHEVSQEYQKAVKRNQAHVDWKKYGLVLLIPYLFIFLIPWTTNFRILLLAAYTIGIFNIPLGIIAGLVLLFFLDNVPFVLFIGVVFFVVSWMKK